GAEHDAGAIFRCTGDLVLGGRVAADPGWLAGAGAELRQGFEGRLRRAEAVHQLAEGGRPDIVGADQPQGGDPLVVAQRRGRHCRLHQADFFSPIRGSVPASSRWILVRCWKNRMIAITATVPASHSSLMTKAKIGAVAAAVSAARDDILRVKAISSQTAQKISATGHDRASNEPIITATPLPPLKPSQTGKQWPRIAPMAATMAASSPQSWRASRIGTAALAASRTSVAAATDLLPVRSTLVAPMLPEP